MQDHGIAADVVKTTRDTDGKKSKHVYTALHLCMFSNVVYVFALRYEQHLVNYIPGLLSQHSRELTDEKQVTKHKAYLKAKRCLRELYSVDVLRELKHSQAVFSWFWHDIRYFFSFGDNWLAHWCLTGRSMARLLS